MAARFVGSKLVAIVVIKLYCILLILCVVHFDKSSSGMAGA